MLYQNCCDSLAVLLSQGCSPAPHYRQHHDGKSLYAVLYNSVSNGTSLAAMEDLLGQGDPIAGVAKDNLLAMARNLANKRPEMFPDGIRDRDSLIGYRTGKQASVVLMFRDGALINHVHGNFKEFDPEQN